MKRIGILLGGLYLFGCTAAWAGDAVPTVASTNEAGVVMSAKTAVRKSGDPSVEDGKDTFARQNTAIGADELPQLHEETDSQPGGVRFHFSLPSTVQSVNRDAVQPIAIAPLTEADFTIGSLRRGDEEAKVLSVYGRPDKRKVTEHFTTLEYDRPDLELRVVLRNPHLPAVPGQDGKIKGGGVEAVYLAKGQDIAAGRGIYLKNVAELLVRAYGAPAKILRDPDANVFYFLYEDPGASEILAFAVADRKIERIAMMAPRAPYADDLRRLDPIRRDERDFTLMGVVPRTAFDLNAYSKWKSMLKGSGGNFWIYGDYGLEADRLARVDKVFLMTNSAYTGRGASIGYHLSTILALYGEPSRIEWGPDGATGVDGYYYDSPYDKDVSLLFVVRHDGQYIDDVILLTGPVTDLQSAAGRYDLAEKKGEKFK